MSKSAPNPSSRILITDSPSVIQQKINRAVTDSDRSLSWDPVERRGVANLLGILAACTEGTAAEMAKQEKTTSYDEQMSTLSDTLNGRGINSHAALKAEVAEAVITRLGGIREEFERLRSDQGYLRDVARMGRDRARVIAQDTMGEVRERVGLGSL